MPAGELYTLTSVVRGMQDAERCENEATLIPITYSDTDLDERHLPQSHRGQGSRE